MEALGGLVVVLLIWFGFNLAIRAGAQTVRAVGRAALGKGSLSDNLEVAFKGMSPMEVRLKDGRLGEEPDAPITKEIEVKGLFPTDKKRRVAFVTSILDNSDDEFKPVLCVLEPFQESHTRAYRHSTEIGAVEPGVGFVGWVRVGIVFPQLLEAPFGGKRKLAAILRLVDLDNIPDITAGFAPSHDGLIWQRRLDFDYVMEGKGYREVEQLRQEARTICIKMALAIAMGERNLSDRQGAVFTSWMQKVLSSYSGEYREQVRSNLNNAMREGYSAAKNGQLSLTEVTYRLKEIGDKASKYEAIELCYEVVAAGDVPKAQTSRIIDLTAQVLELDLSELERIRDAKLIAVPTVLNPGQSVEDLVGIDPAWGPERKKVYLRTEFQKWNNRLTSLPEGTERENAQRMLEAISQARMRYD